MNAMQDQGGPNLDQITTNRVAQTLGQAIMDNTRANVEIEFLRSVIADRDMMIQQRDQTIKALQPPVADVPDGAQSLMPEGESK